ncbi:MAG TPA: tRNA (adenosine(37)-N6)-dimethylallyltransferase MiaA [Gemmatimonadales bacterium]|nr:tRNA (adenosine(37)-N6)-dimethylallyltransferase MiaA [Gemmatimonadales bacterium]
MAAASVPVIVGPTGIGKTAVALALAEHWPIEVVSADSRQVYRRLDIATAKPSAEERRRVPHHGLDQVDPGERYSAGRFAKDAPRWLAEIRTRGRLGVVVGGTGLYIRALVDGLFREPPLDPARRAALAAWTARLESRELLRWAARLDPGFQGGGRQRASRTIEIALLTGRPLSHWQRTARDEGAIRPWTVVLTAPRQVLYQRIRARAEAMLAAGLLDEVAAVLRDGVDPGAPGLDGIGVREAVLHLGGALPRASLAEAIAVATRQYAKRQETWFRHQLTGPVLTLDAVRPPDELARAIARAWDAYRATPNAQGPTR